jgi:hypothetical protein
VVMRLVLHISAGIFPVLFLLSCSLPAPACLNLDVPVAYYNAKFGWIGVSLGFSTKSSELPRAEELVRMRLIRYLQEYLRGALGCCFVRMRGVCAEDGRERR